MEARDEVCEAAEVVCSVRIVVRYAMQELSDRYQSLSKVLWDMRCRQLTRGVALSQ